MNRILYFFPMYSSFIKADEEILLSKYSVKKFHFDGRIKMLTPWMFIKQFFFLIKYIRNTRSIISQFSGYHSFLPSIFGKIFRKPHFIILHGTECNNFPEYNYGYLARPLLFWFSYKSLELARWLLPVSEYLVKQDYTFKETKYKNQGFQIFYPNVQTPYSVIYNGVSPEVFKMDDTLVRQKNKLISVAAALDQSNRLEIKGIDLVLELADRMPDCEFTLVGAKESESLRLPPNVRLIGFVPSQELVQLYNLHNIYLQLSVTEGMPIALLEAMMCGCIPVVSKVGIMPQIVASFGYVLNSKDLVLLEKLIRSALHSSQTPNRQEIRNHVLQNYSLQNRKGALLDMIKSTL